jgi:hypothetical protein
MLTNERLNLVAPCGIECGVCELYTCRDNLQLYSALLSKGIPEDKIPCEGCRIVRGNCPVISGKCETFVCRTEKGLDFCYDCTDFPCSMLNPSADRADVLPHNLKVFNLCTIKSKGIDTFIEESSLIKQKYYKGKIGIGKGPQIN